MNRRTVLTLAAPLLALFFGPPARARRRCNAAPEVEEFVVPVAGFSLFFASYLGPAGLPSGLALEWREHVGRGGERLALAHAGRYLGVVRGVDRGEREILGVEVEAFQPERGRFEVRVRSWRTVPRR